MTDRNRPDSLDALDKRLKAVRQRSGERRRDGPPRESAARGVSTGFRILVELVATLGVGVGVGLVLDGWLGTSPWMLIAFFVLGAAAAFMNVYRVATMIERQAREARRRAQEAADHDETGHGR